MYTPQEKLAKASSLSYLVYASMELNALKSYTTYMYKYMCSSSLVPRPSILNVAHRLPQSYPTSIKTGEPGDEASIIIVYWLLCLT